MILKKLALLAAVSALGLSAATTSVMAQDLSSGMYASGTMAPTVVEGQPITGQPIPQRGAKAKPRKATAYAGRWQTTVNPYVETSVTYSDNIDLAPKGFEQSDTVLTGTAGINATVQNHRIAGSLGYAASYDHYLDDTNDNGLRHNLQTAWNAAVINHLLYLDVGGAVSETYYDDGDRFSGNITANGDDRERTYLGYISPSVRKNIGGWVNAELRYGLQGQFYDEDADAEGTYAHQYRAAVTSDPNRFRRFGWAAVTEYEDFRNEHDSDRDRTRWSTYVSADVPVSRTLAVTGTLGYDQYSDDVTVGDDDLNGVYGNAGLRWQPSTRAGGQVYAGYRNSGFDYGVRATYQARRNLSLSLLAGRAVQFTRTEDTASLLGREVDGQLFYLTPNNTLSADIDDALVRDSSGNWTTFGAANFNEQEEDAIVDSITAQLNGSVGRTGYSVALGAARRDYGGQIADETILSTDLSFQRALTNRASLSLGAGYQRYDVDAAGDLDYETMTLGGGLSYQLTEIVNVFGRYTYTERFADDSANEYRENAGVVGLTASF